MRKTVNRVPDPDESELNVEFVDELPARFHGGTSWANRLMPLLDKPNVWARVQIFDVPEQAYKAQSNLQQRQVKIPEPEHVWEFAARGCEVYAVYRGRHRPAAKKVK